MSNNKKPGIPVKLEGAVVALSIRDRIVLPNLLPQQEGLLAMKISKEIRKKVELSVKELTAVKWTEMKDPGGNPTGRAMWSDSLAEKLGYKKVHFSKAEIDMLKQQVKKLDSEKRVSPEMLDLAILIDEIKT